MANSLREQIADLQLWLNNKGIANRLVVDGLTGPATRAAIFDTFRNTKAPAITYPEIKMLADRLGCTSRQLAAVAQVESSGGGWDNSGLLKCLYERHYAWKRFRINNPLLSNPKPGGYTIDADKNGVNDSWEKVVEATFVAGPTYAFECASFGKFQIMGAWWKKLGYASPMEFVWLQSRTEFAHYEAVCRYIETFGLVKAIRSISERPADCTAFAVGYNGPKQKGYDHKIAASFRKMVA